MLIALNSLHFADLVVIQHALMHLVHVPHILCLLRYAILLQLLVVVHAIIIMVHVLIKYVHYWHQQLLRQIVIILWVDVFGLVLHAQPKLLLVHHTLISHKLLVRWLKILLVTFVGRVLPPQVHVKQDLVPKWLELLMQHVNNF